MFNKYLLDTYDKTGKLNSANSAVSDPSEGHRNGNGVNAWRSLKYKLLAGYFSGLFPVSNIFSFRTTWDLSCKKISFPFLYSWMLLFFKCAGLLYVGSIMRQMNDQVAHQQTLTDVITFGISAVATFFLGVTVHCICVVDTPKLLDLLRASESYSQTYPAVNHLKSRRTIWSHLPSFYIALFPAYVFWYMAVIGLPEVGRTNFRLPGLGLDTDHNIYSILAFAVFVFISLEFAVMYLFETLFSTSQTMVALLNGIIGRAELKFSQESLLMQAAWSKKVELPHPHEFGWKHVADAYLEFQTVYEKYEKYASRNYIVLYLFLSAGIVSASYYVIRSDNPLMQHFAWGQVAEVFVSAYRMYTLASSAEVISQTHNQLVQTLVRMNQVGSTRLEEKFEFEKLLTIVANTPVALSAKGYFTVRRTNLPSLTSAILTYVIVLLQFRMTDKTTIDVRA